MFGPILKTAFFVMAAGIALSLGLEYFELDKVDDAQARVEDRPARATNQSLARDERPSDRLTIPASPDGHFYVDAFVGGTPVRFLVDTGATSVALSRDDAWRLGIAPANEHFTHVSETANGRVRVAPVLIDSLRIGDYWIEDVEAVVIDNELAVSLLGMSYLRRLSNVEITDRTLTLYWE